MYISPAQINPCSFYRIIKYRLNKRGYIDGISIVVIGGLVTKGNIWQQQESIFASLVGRILGYCPVQFSFKLFLGIIAFLLPCQWYRPYTVPISCIPAIFNGIHTHTFAIKIMVGEVRVQVVVVVNIQEITLKLET